MVDINDDGYLDIYVSVSAPGGGGKGADRANLLFINNGNGTFTEAARAYGIADTSYTTHAVFLDYNHDGFLDLFLLNNSPRDFARGAADEHPLGLRSQSSEGWNTLYRNNGDGSLTDVSQDAGLLRHVGKAAVAVIAVQRVPAFGALTAQAEGVLVGGAARKVPGRVIQQEEVEEAVVVVVEKDRMRGVRRVRNAVRSSRLRERAVAVVDEEKIGPVVALAAAARRGHRHVDVEVAVVVDVHHRRARTPPVGEDPGSFEHVFELHVAFVPVQPAGHHVAAEEQVGEAVIVDVPDGHAGAVIDVHVLLHVEGVVRRDRFL